MWRTVLGRYCPAGRIATASKPLCHIAVVQATTCWAPARSPVREMAPGTAPYPNACVSNLWVVVGDEAYCFVYLFALYTE